MGRFDEAVRTLVKLYVNDYYKQADRSFKLKIEIAEVIMQYEAGDNDTVERRIKQIRKSYKDLLKDELLKNDRSILDILQSLSLLENKKLDTKIIRKINDLVDVLTEDGATHVIKYTTWLESLIKNTGK
jgi:hypothetical protein